MEDKVDKYLNYISNNIGNCKIISCFSCLGKTYLGNKYNNILDLEASFYKWIYNDKIIANDVEKRKGITDRIQNPDYPQNYFKAICENINDYAIIAITPELKIREILSKYNIGYFYAFPNNSKFVVNRAFKRGNNEYFALGLKKSYKSWYPKENEYLEDVLKQNNII